MKFTWPSLQHGKVKKKAPAFVWDRSRAAALASHHCQQCRETGLRNAFAVHLQPCGCVLRAIFHACYARYRAVGEQQGNEGTSFMRTGGKGAQRPWSWSRPREEYRADFVLIARRTLTAAEYPLFQLHFLCGLGWRQCAGRLGLDRGNFYHAAYRVEEKLGRAFLETQPYGLYPMHEYMAHNERGGLGGASGGAIAEPKLQRIVDGGMRLPTVSDGADGELPKRTETITTAGYSVQPLAPVRAMAAA